MDALPKGTPAPDRTMRLAECVGILAIIAKIEIDRHGYYLCTIDAERVMVVA